MKSATPTIWRLARRLIALEGARPPSDGFVGEATQVCDRLRVPLAKLAGLAGFRSLMGRALALAAAEVPWLHGVQLRPDGSLDGLQAGGRQPTPDADPEAGIVVVAHLLGLLVTFIGEPLTLHLVRDAWPDAPADDLDPKAGGQT